mgnify:CR=1 FL=1
MPASFWLRCGWWLLLLVGAVLYFNGGKFEALLLSILMVDVELVIQGEVRRENDKQAVPEGTPPDVSLKRR